MFKRNLLKSKYINGIQCHKLLWVAVNDAGRIPPPDAATQYIFDQGHLVCNLALCVGLRSRLASGRLGDVEKR